jgi:hypothetical protein
LPVRTQRAFFFLPGFVEGERKKVSLQADCEQDKKWRAETEQVLEKVAERANLPNAPPPPVNHPFL